MSPEMTVSKEKLVQDLKIVVADAEELLRATASQAGDRAAVAREKIEASLERAKVKLAGLEDVVVDHSKEAARAADEYVHANPWTAVGVAAGIGLLLGLLIGRR